MMKKTQCKGYKKKEEAMAKLCLELLFSDKYMKIVNGDRPDLIDLENKIGIEVTTSRTESDRKKINFINEYISPLKTSSKEKMEIVKKHERELKENINDFFENDKKHLAVKISSDHYSNVLNAINKKEEKLKDYFEINKNTIERYHLFIIAQTSSLDEMYAFALYDVVKKSSYEIIYVLCFDELFIYNNITQKYNVIRLTEDVKKKLKDEYDNN